MQRETTNQDFPVNFRGIALTGQHRSKEKKVQKTSPHPPSALILISHFFIEYHITLSSLHTWQIRLVSLRSFCVPLWIASCGCTKVCPIVIIVVIIATVVIIIIIATVTAIIIIISIVFIIVIITIAIVIIISIIMIIVVRQPCSQPAGSFLRFSPATSLSQV